VEHAAGVLAAFKKYDTNILRTLSDKILADGFIERNKQVIRLAIISHSLSKIAEKEYYRKDQEKWGNFMILIEKGFEELSKDDKKITVVEKAVVDLDKHFGRYKESIIHLSKIRKGSTLYAWGVSLTMASELVDVPEYELMKHIGSTKIVDEEGLGVSVSQRLKDAEDVL